MSKKPLQKKPEVGTTGHSWDGIEELNNPLPRWWLWLFYATIIWGLIWTILYPAWPISSQGATPGLLGYSSRQAVEADIRKFEERNAPLDQKLVAADLTTVRDDAELYSYAVKGGAAVFRTWCAQCHGSGAQGAVGFPNLLDDDWLWGGTIEDIYYTVAHGVRNEDDPDARYSEMPKWGEILEPEEIDAVVQYVLKISGQSHDAARAEAGATVFADNCAACHGDDGKGDPAQGAPNLTDAIWLYGGDEAAITESVTNSRFGVMPAWSTRLSDAQVRQAALYVHQLGGGQ
ncbi:MAG: cytochrome-c oxidase, cbb3-type subunit III [Alphaproteobacteria bacterium]|nr:MAG: cytochrome-c oxidase, cbb3-type subunit III [Alphaproteobacteria bacterium]